MGKGSYHTPQTITALSGFGNEKKRIEKTINAQIIEKTAFSNFFLFIFSSSITPPHFNLYSRKFIVNKNDIIFFLDILEFFKLDGKISNEFLSNESGRDSEL